MNIEERLSAEQKALINAWTEKVENPAKPFDENDIPGLIPAPGVKKPSQHESILFMIKEDIEKARSLAQAQQIIDDFIEKYQINHPRSKNEYKALISLRDNKSYEKLLSHLFMSILKYSGLTSPDAHRNRNRYK